MLITLGLTACQKPDSKKVESAVDQTAASQVPDTSLLLQGDRAKLKLNLPECDGNTCPEFSIERLQSNQPFVDKVIDQAILDNLDKMLGIAQLSKKLRINSKPVHKLQPVKSTQTRLQRNNYRIVFNLIQIHSWHWTKNLRHWVQVVRSQLV